jgi:beta-1,4-mannooligosaccharide/beta-1,4-mannosyl-N-acetylglucosamine phosphorylase
MLGGNVDAIHNSGIVKFKGKYVGLFRVDDQGLREGLYKGTSVDGVKWEIEKTWIKVKSAAPDAAVDPIRKGFDPRIIKIDDVYYVVYCLWAWGHKSSVSVLRTTDFENFEHVGFPFIPQNRNGVLFPRKINGRYVMLSRPSSGGDADIFLSHSPDLIYWGDHHMVMEHGGGWGWLKIGPGPAPIEIDEGWLLIFHGVRNSCSGSIYCAGGAILDRDQPWKVLHRGVRFLLAPTEDYERVGDVFNVVFPTSLIHDETTGALDLYYGCADTRIGLAHANIRDVVKFIIENRAVDGNF